MRVLLYISTIQISTIGNSTNFSNLNGHQIRQVPLYQIGRTDTVDAGYKNTVGSREECSYIRYVLITGTFSMGKDRNGSHTMVLITDMFLEPASTVWTVPRCSFILTKISDLECVRLNRYFN